MRPLPHNLARHILDATMMKVALAIHSPLLNIALSEQRIVLPKHPMQLVLPSIAQLLLFHHPRHLSQTPIF